ncbi:MAG: DUF5522 domain-containing protein [Acidimicrobiia bacterium]
MLADRPLDTPSVQRLAPDHPGRAEILARHRAALVAGARTYVDPTTGYWVFTAWHLVDVGSCCDRGCRHCPYVD